MKQSEAKPKIKAVIFDLDGVLVEAREWHYESLNRALKELCNYTIPREDHEKIFNGLPTRVKVAKLIGMGKLPPDIDLKAINDLKQKHTLDLIRTECKPDFHKFKMIDSLKKKGIKIGCVTNSIKQTAELMLKKTKIFELFDIVITNEHVKAPKPSPSGYLLAFEKLKVLPSETIIVEDSEYGFRAATDSGAYVIRVDSPFVVDISLFKGHIN